MKTKPDSHTRTRTCTRRLSACTRHPDVPITGICASCLRERLSGIDSSAVNDASSSAFSTDELRRSRSVSATKCEASCVYSEPRRKSCDDRSRNSLAELLFVETSVPIGSVKVESDKLGFGGDDDEVGEGEVKTMKEHIDLVIESGNQKKPKDSSSFWEAASVLSKKLQIWKPLKHKNKKIGQGNPGNGVVDECKLKAKKLGQREPSRLSVDAGRISVDRSRRLSLDEPRASWDGYLIAKTIPRLAPMLSVVENEMLWGGNKLDSNRLSVDGQMQSIIEDESSSGGLDSNSSQRWSSFDRSVSLASSGKKTTTGLESDEGNLMSPTKLVITESELKDWRLKSSVNKDENCNFEPIGKAATSGEACGNVNNGSKKSTRWGKMFNVLNKTPKSSERNCDYWKGIAVESLVAEGCERREKGGGAKETLGSKHTGIENVANPKKSFDMFGFNQTARNGKQVKEGSDKLVSARNSFDVSRLYQSMRNGGEMKDGRKLSRLASSRRSLDMIGLDHDSRNFTKDNVFAKKGEEFFELELNKSAKNSSRKIDDNTLPFYLTPLRTSKSSKSGRHRPQNSISLNGNILESN